MEDSQTVNYALALKIYQQKGSGPFDEKDAYTNSRRPKAERT